MLDGVCRLVLGSKPLAVENVLLNVCPSYFWNGILTVVVMGEGSEKGDLNILDIHLALGPRETDLHFQGYG